MSIAFWQLFFVLLGLVAAFFVSRANLGLTPEVIARLSESYMGYNPNMVRHLAVKAADNWVGISLLVVSVALQVALLVHALLFPLQSSPAQSIPVAEIVLAVVCAFVVLLLCFPVTKWAANRFLDAAQSSVEQGLKRQ